MLSEEKAIIEVRKLRDANKRNSLGKSIDTVLNLITKLQKEKEDLLREKEENKFIIAMANNEMLGYNQGYSDAENKNSNATEIVIKNRQAYIHKEEVELYKRKIDFLQKENEEKDKQIKTLNHTNKTYKGMLNKQNKQIDLIAFSLADYVMYYEYDKCRNPEMIKQKAKEFKQYFETKAKGE